LEPKTCPILGQSCTEAKCAWYDDKEKCAVLVKTPGIAKFG
jgi:hypothetical protein